MEKLIPMVEKKEDEESKDKERLVNARRLFDNFFELKPQEKVLFITDKNPQNTDKRLVDVFKRELQRRTVDFKEIIADENTKTQDIALLLDEFKFIWASCNWDDTGIDFYKLTEELLPQNQSRMEDAAGIEVASLDSGGFLAEDREVVETRMTKMISRLKNASGLHVRTSYGTDLWIKLSPDRRWVGVCGIVDPGEWDNPGAEVFTTPDEEGENGVLVLSALQDEITKDQGVDKFVYLTIQNGKISKIDGGELAEKLRLYLQEHSKDEGRPLSVVQCSEVAFGASEFARSKVRDERVLYTEAGVGVLEAEKRLGTMHIAFGSNQHGVEGASGSIESDVHIDFVLPRRSLTVTAFNSLEDFNQRKNGERLIDQGRLNLIY